DEVDAVAPATEPDWLQEVNLDPRYRVFAGAGTEVIRRNQEDYMNIAWQQIGEVMEANRKLNQLKVTKAANYAVYDRHLLPLQDAMLLNICAPAHTRIFNDANQRTVYGDVEIIAVPVASLTGVGRRFFIDYIPLT